MAIIAPLVYLWHILAKSATVQEMKKVVCSTYEKHCFFTRRLIAAGVDPQTAEREACRMEHTISQRSFELLKGAVEPE